MHPNTIPNVQTSGSSVSNNFRIRNHGAPRRDVTPDVVTRKEFNQVVRELKILKARTAKDVEPENSQTRRPRNKHLGKIVSDSFKTYSDEFDFEVKGMLTGSNLDVFKRIKTSVYGTDYFKTNMCFPDGRTKPGMDREIKEFFRVSYDSLKKKLALQKDPVLLEQRRAQSNKRSRMSRKLKNRVKTFSGNQDSIASKMQLPLEECKAFLIKECMSEEEDDEFYPNSRVAASLKVNVPTWRSDKLNQLFGLIDQTHFEQSSHLGETKRRVLVNVSLNTPLEVVDKRLPAWGFNK